jgi:hypothetical protein
MFPDSTPLLLLLLLVPKLSAKCVAACTPPTVNVSVKSLERPVQCRHREKLDSGKRGDALANKGTESNPAVWVKQRRKRAPSRN